MFESFFESREFVKFIFIFSTWTQSLLCRKLRIQIHSFNCLSNRGLSRLSDLSIITQGSYRQKWTHVFGSGSSGQQKMRLEGKQTMSRSSRTLCEQSLKGTWCKGPLGEARETGPGVSVIPQREAMKTRSKSCCKAGEENVYLKDTKVVES